MVPDSWDALLIVSFGGPEGPSDVMPFLENTVRGRQVPRERLAEVAQHYELFGGVSPINAQSRALAFSIQARLEVEGPALPVYLGNRNWKPYLATTLEDMMRSGVKNALAFIASPYCSYSSCGQYLDDLERSRSEVGPGAPTITWLRHYFNHPGFIEAVADLASAALGSIPLERRASTAVAFTAHSIPVTMAAACGYTRQLQEAASLVAARLDEFQRWDLVWQSRSGAPNSAWLEPQIGAHLEGLAEQGFSDVVVVPIGFISDHIEVLYDLDTEARAVAGRLGLNLVRAPTVGIHPQFVDMIRELILERTRGLKPRQLGNLGVYPSGCRRTDPTAGGASPSTADSAHRL